MTNNQKKPIPVEVIETELNVICEEYKTLREEILTNIDASRQVLNLTLSGIGLFLAISPQFIESQLQGLFLVVPFVFYAMAWAQLRYVFLAQDISDYLREIVEPKIRKNLVEIASTADRDFSAVMGWSNEVEACYSTVKIYLFFRLLVRITVFHLWQQYFRLRHISLSYSVDRGQ